MSDPTRPDPVPQDPSRQEPGDPVLDAELVDDVPRADVPTSPGTVSPVRPTASPQTDYTDAGVPTFDYVRDRIEGRAATASAAEELAGGDAKARDAEDAYAERERKGTDRLAEIRRQMGR
ncbi:PspA/IM30 family protein [Pseudonocardia phyllosphaerae]|uniref:PspA/IM30 family protein n=1 Tax=Pseudonocardia phyllosphaerae TaxID=3390502 RepID=UPI00397CECEF